MGHYDSCYEADDAAYREKREQQAVQSLTILTHDGSLSLEEKEFVIRIARNVKDYMIFFKVLNWNHIKN